MFPSLHSIAHSVHFERDNEGNLCPQPGDEEEEMDAETSLSSRGIQDQQDPDTVNDVQKRKLDQFCFTEHLEPHVLLQVQNVHSHSVRLKWSSQSTGKY